MSVSRSKDNDDTMSIMTASPQPPLVLRRVALFVDGMARAIILPFGPTLIDRLVYGETSGSLAPGVAFYLAWVVSVYSLGRWLGTIMASRFNFAPDRLPIMVARFAGAALALHIFTYGAGLKSVLWLVLIRLLSAMLVGLLCGITRNLSLPEDDWVYRNSTDVKLEEEAMRRREAYVDIASGTAKIYLTGFAVSILSGGLLFRKATKDHTFRALTGAYQYTLSPLFLVCVAVVTEIVLRTIFAMVSSKSDSLGNDENAVRLVRRIVSDKKRHESYSPLPVRDSLHETIDEGECEDDFPDPLSGAAEEAALDDSLHYATPAVRSRVESYTSLDDFYDCRSVFSDMEMSLASVPLATDDQICRYVDRKCVYSDGTPAYVPQGDRSITIPPNYLAFYNGNRNRAQKAWEATQQWRYEQKVWKIHSMPNIWFPKIKQAYPHFAHGHSKAGYPIIYEQPGRMNLKELFRNGCAIDDMVRHYTFFMEFVSNRICTREEIRAKMGPDAPPHNSSSWGIMVVMDVKGAGLSHLSGDVVKYLKRAGDINSAHYPMSMKRAFLVNSPFWLAGAWSGIKGILPESVHVDILSASKYPDALKEFIDEDQIPPEYGGTSPYPLGEHPYEVELRKLAEEAEDGVDEEMVAPPLIISAPSPAQEAVRHADSPLPFTPDRLKNSKTSKVSGSQPMRRKLGSVDRVVRQLDTINDSPVKGSKAGDMNVFTITSVLFTIWSAVQGGIETALPLWILSPATEGGLGYSPSRSGVSMFCASLALLWSLRTKYSRLVSQLPSKVPMRAFRIGVGSESVLLALLAVVTTSVSPIKRRDSVLVMASTIIAFSCTVLASMLGRSASKILHRIAADSFASSPRSQQIYWFSRFYGKDQLRSDCETGRFTTMLNIAGEISGITLVAPLWSWSVSHNRPAPFDATCVLYVASLVTFGLYVCSFSLYLNRAGEFAPHPKDSCADMNARRCIPFVGEVVAVSAGDMASLFEEANWTSTPLLSTQTSRTFSETTSQLEMIERGEFSSDGRKAR